MNNMENVVIIKKDGTEEKYNGQKIITAVGKSAKKNNGEAYTGRRICYFD